MRAAVYIYTVMATVTACTPAAAWTPEEIGKAVDALDKATYDPLKTLCSEERTVDIVHDVKAVDLNNDGVDELMVTTRSEPDLDCFGYDHAQLDLLVSDGQGGWTEMFYRYGSRFDVEKPASGGWPMLSIVLGETSCRPQYRWDHGVYREVSFCDGDGNRILVSHGSEAYIDHFDTGVIPPFLAGCIRRIYAAIFSFWAGVIPPMPMFGRSLL